MRRIVVTAAVAVLVASSAARATQQNSFFYHVRTQNSFTSMCNGGDLVTGCGVTCPPAQHAQKSDLTLANGLQGCRANCQTPDAEIKPVNITAFCVHQECDDQGVCFVDPDGVYQKQ